jgi:hypothetical protein
MVMGLQGRHECREQVCEGGDHPYPDLPLLVGFSCAPFYVHGLLLLPCLRVQWMPVAKPIFVTTLVEVWSSVSQFLWTLIVNHLFLHVFSDSLSIVQFCQEAL